jgi:antitoxin component of MazEF toxin-antitoxin module
MERTIFRSGNSHAVTLPPSVMKAFGLSDGSKVQVEIDEERGGILIVPTERTIPGVDADFMRLIDEFIEEYRPALEELARR